MGGNGLHMDLKEHRHHSYVVYLMKQSNPGARLLLLHTHVYLPFLTLLFTFYLIPRISLSIQRSYTPLKGV